MLLAPCVELEARGRTILDLLGARFLRKKVAYGQNPIPASHLFLILFTL